mgnify:CR=1 FL=1
MKQKNMPFWAVSILVVSTILFIYSCSSNEYDFLSDSSMEKPSTRAASSYRTQLLNSVSESDDFLDFVIACNVFSDKIDMYISTLSEAEKMQMIKNANNDDYILDFAMHIDVKNEIEEMAAARKKLFANSSYLQLDDLEKSELFYHNFIVEPVFVKTREEGGNVNDCQKAKDAAYDAAYKNMIKRLSLCDYLPNDDKFACQIGVKLNYEAEKTQADTNYKKCIGDDEE